MRAFSEKTGTVGTQHESFDGNMGDYWHKYMVSRDEIMVSSGISARA